MTKQASNAVVLDETVALKTANARDGSTVEIHKRHATKSGQPDNDQAFQPSDSDSVQPGKTRRPWVLAMLFLAAVAAVGGGVTYYFYALSYESTDDAFVEAHVVAVSPRVAGHVTKIYVTDNQWVNQGDLLAELDPRDFEARLAAAKATLLAAQAGQRSHSIGADVTEITSTAGMDEASAGVEGQRDSLVGGPRSVVRFQGLEVAKKRLNPRFQCMKVLLVNRYGQRRSAKVQARVPPSSCGEIRDTVREAVNARRGRVVANEIPIEHSWLHGDSDPV